MTPGSGRFAQVGRVSGRAMRDSTDRLSPCLEGVSFPVDDFYLYELGRILQEGEARPDNEEFRFLIEQGIRSSVDSDLGLRARLVECLRVRLKDMAPADRRIAREVIGGIEDLQFELERIGAVVRCYTQCLFRTFGSGEDASAPDDSPNTAVSEIADRLFESLDDPARVDADLEALAGTQSQLAARVLAYAISEPILEEPQEEHARAILSDLWPMGRSFVLYRLKQHLHEDLPFRWFELLVERGEERAVDRILEEVLVHARLESYREDLFAILGLVDRSPDPGRVGKVLRLLTEDALPPEARSILEEWLRVSPLSTPVDEALGRFGQGEVILIPDTDDLCSFASRYPGPEWTIRRTQWEAAFHERLGWRPYSAFQRGPVAFDLERMLVAALDTNRSLLPDADSLRAQLESLREEWLLTPRNGTIPFVELYQEFRRDDPWDEALYQREINEWYVRAAQRFDEGDTGFARRLLEAILLVEPEYPLARVLARLIDTA